MIKRIENYSDFKKAWGNCSYYGQMRDLHENSPDKYDMYKERLKKEKLKENDPAAYYLQYCCKKEC